MACADDFYGRKGIVNRVSLSELARGSLSTRERLMDGESIPQKSCKIILSQNTARRRARRSEDDANKRT
jgi:hypothetical protein